MTPWYPDMSEGCSKSGMLWYIGLSGEGGTRSGKKRF